MTARPETGMAVGIRQLFLAGALLLFTARSFGQSPPDPLDRFYPHPFQITPFSKQLYPSMEGPKPLMPAPSFQTPVNQQPTTLPDENEGQRKKEALYSQLMEDDMFRANEEWLAKSYSYRMAFNDLTKCNPDSFSLTRAQYDVENSYLDNRFSYTQFLNGVKLRADLVRQILKREGLKANNLTINYCIQKLYQQTNLYYDSVKKRAISVPPFKYDFEDFRGDKDLTNLFTSKLLTTFKGQCSSMPRLYLMIAEQLGAKAWLSLAPLHSYIQFEGKDGALRSFETTNGYLVSPQWMINSGFINTKAIKNRSYLDTLSHRQLFSQLLVDLLWNYLRNFPYDDFAEAIKQKALQVDPGNMRALIIDANHKKQIALQKIIAAGRPMPNDLPKYPAAYQAYLQSMDAFRKVDELGYQNMPPDAYQRWLQSIEQEKQKQAIKEIRAKMQREIQSLKKRSTLINKLR